MLLLYHNSFVTSFVIVRCGEIANIKFQLAQLNDAMGSPLMVDTNNLYNGVCAIEKG